MTATWLTFLLAASQVAPAEDILTCKIARPAANAVFRVAAFPSYVRIALGPMANPGKPYQAEDMGGGNLPLQQLIYAVPRNDGWLIYSIHGGRTVGCDARLVRKAER